MPVGNTLNELIDARLCWSTENLPAVERARGPRGRWCAWCVWLGENGCVTSQPQGGVKRRSTHKFQVRLITTSHENLPAATGVRQRAGTMADSKQPPVSGATFDVE